jgi:hypothetical protein
MNWLIPGYNGTNAASTPTARDNRLSGQALEAATQARAAGDASTAYKRRADGSYQLPTDALGVVPMMSKYGGVGAVRVIALLSETGFARGMVEAHVLLIVNSTHS